MKFTATLILLLTLGLVNAADLKTESGLGKYPDWKTLAEKAKKLAADKSKVLEDLASKMEAEPKKKVDPEVVSVKALVVKVTQEADKIIALQESDYKNAKTSAEKDAVSQKAAPLGKTLAEHFISLDAALRKGSLIYTTQISEKEGMIKVLEFLKGKVDNLEKDAFFVASVVAAAALSTLALGSVFN